MKARFNIFVVLLVSLFLSSKAQSVFTTVSKDFVVNRYSFTNSYSFKAGDTVEVFGFKKKGKEYHVALQKGDYVEAIKMAELFFNADAKEFKKLPDALSQQVKDEIKTRQTNIIAGKKRDMKERALQGKIKRKLKTMTYFYCTEGTSESPSRDDSVYVIGYKNEGYHYDYALYNEKTAGVFRTTEKSPFTLDVITDYMPSTDDVDVQAELQRQKTLSDERKEKQRKKKYEDALKGLLKGVVKGTGLKGDENAYGTISFGDTVSIFGFKKEDGVSYYALSNDKVAGIYKWDYKYREPFDIAITTRDVPSTEDSMVIAEIEKRKKENMERKILKDSLDYVKMSEEINAILENAKKYEPAIITVDGWDADSAGGITVDISVRNTSTQTIKYITFKGYFTNPVGDRCYNEIGGGTVWTGKGIGPIEARPTSVEDFIERSEKCRGSYSFDNAGFYSRTAEYFHLSSVVIQYMNGKTVALTGKALDRLVIYK